MVSTTVELFGTVKFAGENFGHPGWEIMCPVSIVVPRLTVTGLDDAKGVELLEQAASVVPSKSAITGTNKR
jgi:hypothetical protein